MKRHILLRAFLGVILSVFSTLHINAATIEFLDTNPVRDACLLKGTATGWADYSHDDRSICGPEDKKRIRSLESLRAPWQGPDNPFFWDGTQTPHARGLYAGMFIADGSHTYIDNHHKAALTALRDTFVIRVTGVIKPGDLDRLKQVITENDAMICAADGFCPYNSVISLNSPGGSLSEALKIAEFITENQFVTLLEPGARCESSCSFVFFAGYTNYGGFHFPRRFADITARLGVHRPALSVRDDKYDADDIAKAAQLSNTVLAEAMQVFIDAGVDMDLLKQMYDTPATSMSYLTSEQIAQVATVLGRGHLTAERLTRAQVLRHCATEFSRGGNGARADLLANLFVGKDSFITFADYGQFYCAGARTPEGVWITETCFEDSICVLPRCSEHSADWDTAICPVLPPSYQGDYQILVSFGSLSHGLATLSGSQILNFARDALLDWHQRDDLYHLTSRKGHVMTSAGFPKVPQAYCGAIDFRDPPIARRLQAALNAAGYDAGPEDGLPGRKTEAAIVAASETLLGRSSMRASEPLLAALGLADAEIAALRFCADAP